MYVRYCNEKKGKESYSKNKMVDLDKCRVVAIIGNINTGKTNLAVSLLRNYQGKRKIFFLGYPKQIDKFKMISSKRDLLLIKDGIIFIDELNLLINMSEERTSQEFIKLVSLLAHSNNTLIFTTALSHTITRKMESFIDTYLLTKIEDTDSLKQGGQVKKIIKNTPSSKTLMGGLYLELGEYLEFSFSNQIGENKIKNFTFQYIGKDWKIK